ncbi:MAG: tetratricopeptide repeat protein, partial [Flavobacteriales bacterium]|nr:tetratricopeptide repeat protein [Flavobacteriales bacterium]
MIFNILPQGTCASHLESVNGIKFTRREVDIIAYLLSGKSAKTIATCLSIAPKTIEAHMRNIMMKVECNSRDGIIEFVEKSKKLPSFKEHYINLLTNASFEEELSKIAIELGDDPLSCVIIYWDDREYFYDLEKHLKLAGIKTSSEMRRSHLFFRAPINDGESRKSKFIIYAVPREMIEQEVVNKKGEVVSFIQKLKETSNSIVALFSNNSIHNDCPQDSNNIGDVQSLEQKTYYDFVFMILKRFLPNIVLDQIILEFKSHCESICGANEIIHEPLLKADKAQLSTSQVSYLNGYILNFFDFIKARKKSFFIGSVFSVGLFCIWTLAVIGNKEGKLTQHKKLDNSIAVIANLSIPTQTVLLDRPQLMERIDKSLKVPQDIQTIALVGIGGAGKTTLARQYARQQNADVVWELDADSREDLNDSFKELAEALSKTEEEKEKLKSFRDITNTEEREKKIVSFVRNKLKHVPSWILIYDNVAKFEAIQNHFPHNPSTWGRGKVVLITRDDNIGHNNHINEIIQIGELSPEEKLTLFAKIMVNGKSSKLTSTQIEQAKKFLNDIPPFPLDVSIAAYYLKATNVPYEKYLEHLKEHNKDFASVQENVLREATDYAKTRYRIITLSLKDLIDTHKDFGDLLLLVSLLDNQNIPRDLLNIYKGDVVVEDFIYNLKKYSFVTNESPASSSPFLTFSIHPSTQEICLRYLIQALNLDRNSHSLQEIFNTLEVHVAEAIDKEDFLKLKLLLSHCEKLISHQDLLTDAIKRSLGGELGYIYFYLGNYKKSRKIIEVSLQGLDKNHIRNHGRLAHILVYLGDVYREFGDYEKAKDLLEKSLAIYEENPDKDYMGMAQAMVNLGNVYRRLGNYEKAKRLLEESLIIYRQHSNTNHPAIARTLATLANIYRSLSQYKKAKDLFNESLTIYKNHFPENHPRIAWTLAHLGNVHREIGDYKQAKDLIERSLMIYRQHFSENHAKVGWVLSLLGDIYRKLGNYEKAKDLFEQALIVFKDHFPENDSKIAHSLMDLGDVYGHLGDRKKAKNLLEKSLLIYKEHFPEKFDEISQASTYLAKIHMELGDCEVALALLNESLKILKIHFKEEHQRTLLASLYLGNTYKNLGNYEKAKIELQGCLYNCEKIYGKNHIETARILRALGEIFFLEGQKETAKNFLREALEIFQKNEH